MEGEGKEDLEGRPGGLGESMKAWIGVVDVGAEDYSLCAIPSLPYLSLIKEGVGKSKKEEFVRHVIYAGARIRKIEGEEYKHAPLPGGQKFTAKDLGSQKSTMNDFSTLIAPSPVEMGQPSTSRHSPAPSVFLQGLFVSPTIPVAVDTVEPLHPRCASSFVIDRLFKCIASTLPSPPPCEAALVVALDNEWVRPVHRSKTGRIKGTQAHMIPSVGSSWLQTAIVHIEYVGSSSLYTLTAWMRMMEMMQTLFESLCVSD